MSLFNYGWWHCWYQVYVSILQRRAESTTITQHKPAKLRHYLPGTLQQFIPACSTAVHNQQDRRRASDGGRATAGERCICTQQIHSSSSSTCSSRVRLRWRLYIYWTTWCISILVLLLCTTNKSGGGRAKVDERQRASDMYVHSNTAVPAAQYQHFFCSIQDIYQQSSTSTKFIFLLTTRTNFQRRRASDGGQATTFE